MLADVLSASCAMRKIMISASDFNLCSLPIALTWIFMPVSCAMPSVSHFKAGTSPVLSSTLTFSPPAQLAQAVDNRKTSFSALATCALAFSGISP